MDTFTLTARALDWTYAALERRAPESAQLVQGFAEGDSEALHPQAGVGERECVEPIAAGHGRSLRASDDTRNGNELLLR